MKALRQGEGLLAPPAPCPPLLHSSPPALSRCGAAPYHPDPSAGVWWPVSISAERFWDGGAGGAPSQKLIPRVLLQPCLEALHTLVGTSREGSRIWGGLMPNTPGPHCSLFFFPPPQTPSPFEISPNYPLTAKPEAFNVFTKPLLPSH